MSRARPRTFLVTGGSRGIGRAVGRELARVGHAVVLAGRQPGSGERAAASLRRSGFEALGLHADVSRPREVRSLVSRAVAWNGRLDGLVLSAGIYDGSSTEETSDDRWRQVLAVDLDGTFSTIQAAAPALRQHTGASIVTLSSILGSHAGPGALAYQAAKAAIEQMTRALALELAPAIRVNAVAPGFIRTDMNREGHTDPKYAGWIARRTPVGRWGEPGDVARVVRFLMSSEARFITGAVIPVDGGLSVASGYLEPPRKR